MDTIVFWSWIMWDLQNKLQLLWDVSFCVSGVNPGVEEVNDARDCKKGELFY